MAKTIEEIKDRLASLSLSASEALLTEFLEEQPKSAEGHFLLGNLFRKQELWDRALNEYLVAMDLDPSSPAAAAYEMSQRILNFYDHNRYNQ